MALRQHVKRPATDPADPATASRGGARMRPLVGTPDQATHGGRTDLAGGSSAGTDTRDRASIEQALRASEERYRLAMRASGSAVWDWDVKSGRMDWSPEAHALFGYPADGIPADAAWWRSGIHPDDRARVEAGLDAALSGGPGVGNDAQPWSDEYRFRRGDGSYALVCDRALVLRAVDGAPVRMIGARTDVTERRAAERALADADRRKDEFLATLAHELRNPLAPLSNALAVLERSHDRALVEASCQTMKRQVRQLVRLVDDLLEVSRVATGKLKVTLDRIEMHRVLQHAIETAGPRIDAGRHRLVVEPARREVWLMGDRARLAQVFTNLLDNAAKYTEPGGTITLRVDPTVPGRVRVSVADTGVGIDADALPQVFDLFTQIERGSDRAQGGLGIGLSLARRLVELHDGNITVASPGAGAGTTVTVDLAVAQAPSGAPATTNDERARAGVSCTVLVADDNHDAADTLRMMLTIAGHRVAVVYGGHDAIEAAMRDPPQLAILDIGMPRVDGYEVARRLRSDLRERCPVLIALTGWGQETDKRRAMDAGFDHHFTKPIDPAHIETIIRAICEREAQNA